MHPSSSPSVNIVQNIENIRHQIDNLCQKYQRQPESVQLLAVSKTKPESAIRAAYAAGQTRFGENYLQDALPKIQHLADLDIEWHFIGSIQSNKTREIAEHFDWVHSVSRTKIARRLSAQRPDSLPDLNICLQINISEEDSKSGFRADELQQQVAEIIRLPKLKLRGLMAIPARAEGLQEQREVFARMRTLLESLQQTYPQLDTLSMGMTNDMEAAIAEGSTLLRIGTAIFGARNNA